MSLSSKVADKTCEVQGFLLSLQRSSAVLFLGLRRGRAGAFCWADCRAVSSLEMTPRRPCLLSWRALHVMVACASFCLVSMEGTPTKYWRTWTGVDLGHPVMMRRHAFCNRSSLPMRFWLMLIIGRAYSTTERARLLYNSPRCLSSAFLPAATFRILAALIPRCRTELTCSEK